MQPGFGSGLLDGGRRPFGVFLVFIETRALFVLPTAEGQGRWDFELPNLIQDEGDSD